MNLEQKRKTSADPVFLLSLCICTWLVYLKDHFMVLEKLRIRQIVLLGEVQMFLLNWGMKRFIG